MRSENGTASERTMPADSSTTIYFSPVQQEKKLTSSSSWVFHRSSPFSPFSILDAGAESVEEWKIKHPAGLPRLPEPDFVTILFQGPEARGRSTFLSFFQSAGGREESRRLSVDVTSIHRFHHLLLYGIFFLLCSIQPHCTSQTILSTA
jgi:hypothetical protein